MSFSMLRNSLSPGSSEPHAGTVGSKGHLSGRFGSALSLGANREPRTDLRSPHCPTHQKSAAPWQVAAKPLSRNVFSGL